MLKRLSLIICILVLSFTLVACSTSEKDEAQIKEALEIAKSVPTPIIYSDVNGLQILYDDSLDISIHGYDTGTGDPIFEISRGYYTPHTYLWDKWDNSHYTYGDAFLFYKDIQNNAVQSYWPIYHFTLTELKQNKDRLSWWR